MEITEEEEEEQREKKRQSTVDEEDRPRSSASRNHDPPPADTTTAAPVTLDPDLADSLTTSGFTNTSNPPHFFAGAPPRPSSPAKSLDDAARRRAVNSNRPDLYSYSTYTYGKPKVKLGPRPSLDVGGRPRTSCSADGFRPVASIPTGLKSSKSVRKGRAQDRATSSLPSDQEEATHAPDIAFLATSIPIPENGPLESGLELARPHTSGGGAPSQSSSAHGKVGLPALPTAAPKRDVITPEKARLIKAMKLREMKKKMGLTPPDVAPVATGSAPESDTPAPCPQSEVSLPVAETEGNQREIALKPEGDAESRLSMSNPDSGVAIEGPNDQISVDARSDSHPTSPIASSFDIGDSTKASSVSESTDETVQPNHEQKLDEQDGVGEEFSLALPASIKETGEDGQDDSAREANEAVEANETNETSDSISLGGTLRGEQEDGITEPTVETGDEKALAQNDFSTAVPVQTPDADEVGGARLNAGTDVEERTDSQKGDGTNGGTTDSPQFAVPLSKFSRQQGRPAASTTIGPIPSIVTPLPEAELDSSTKDRKSINESEISTSEAETVSIETRRSKRKVLVERIRTDLDVTGKERAQSDSNLSEDDDLMDELQSATLQQAKPVTVSKSPITPVFPKPDIDAEDEAAAAGAERALPGRAVSNPIRAPLVTPTGPPGNSARSVSSGAAFGQNGSQQASSDLRPKTAKIGSSISQRIKALEKLSATTAAAEAAGQKERPSSSFFSVRKASLRHPSRPPSVDLSGGPASPSSPGSLESSPASARTRRDRSGSMASRLSVFEGGSAPRGRPESIRVTARIIRDPSQPYPKAPEPKAAADYGPLDLKQSPLVVDHQRASPGTSPSATPAPAVTPPAPAPADEREETRAGRRLSLFQRRLSRDRRSQSQDRAAEAAENEPKDDAEPASQPRRRSSLTVVKDFIRDRRGSVISNKSPSTDNLNLNASPGPGLGNVTSPTAPSLRSPSRPPSVHHNSVFPRRLSISSRRSSIDQKSPAQGAGGLAASPFSPTETGADLDGDDKKSRPGSSSASITSQNGNKNGNRASRFMRRLSSSFSSRKNVTPSISPTVAEEEDADIAAQNGARAIQTSDGVAAAYAPPSIVAYMGDVNVQFPDNLLWKRRTICLDSQGFLILSAIQGMSAAVPATATGTGKDFKQQAGAIKRYHLGDFRPPYTPEMEMQELPNSIVLDFIEGSGLQIACEDRPGQLNVLHSQCPPPLSFASFSTHLNWVR